MAQYRAAIIGLGWMGMLYDLAQRTGEWHVDDIDRPTPELDIHRQFYFHNHPGEEGLPSSYAEALWNRPEIDLIAAAERDRKRLRAFTERYGVQAVYEDAEEMLRKEKPDIVAIATNTKHRADLTCLAVECGAKGIFTEKPMAHTLEEAILHLLEAKIAMFELVIGEIDMILGNLDEEREFEDLVADLWLQSQSPHDFRSTMDNLGERLIAAKEAYLEQRSYEDRLFGERFTPESKK